MGSSFVPRTLTAAHWSISCVDLDTGANLLAISPDLVLSCASVGKVLALLDLAGRCDAGLDPATTELSRRTVEPVGDSGLWQFLTVEALSLQDIASLIGAVSDNLASNVLIEFLGLAAIDRVRAARGLTTLRLHDIVRDERLATHPERLSSGSAGEWAQLMAELARGETASGTVESRVLAWLSRSMDLTMVPATLRADPLSHGSGPGPCRVVNKTGTDRGVRADVGLLTGPFGRIAYAAICNFDAEAVALGDVMQDLNDLGAFLVSRSSGP